MYWLPILTNNFTKIQAVFTITTYQKVKKTVCKKCSQKHRKYLQYSLIGSPIRWRNMGGRSDKYIYMCKYSYCLGGCNMNYWFYSRCRCVRVCYAISSRVRTRATTQPLSHPLIFYDEIIPPRFRWNPLENYREIFKLRWKEVCFDNEGWRDWGEIFTWH